MAHLPNEVHRLFAQQHGVAGTTQLLEFLTADQIERFEANGSIVGVLRGVYRTPSRPVDELSRCAAVCVGRPYVAIAGPTAGRLWGFRRLPADRRIHVVAPPGRKPVSATWVVAYRTSAIRECDVLHRADGIRITSRARTALDLARSVTPDDLLSIIEQAMHDGKLTEADMYSVAVDWISPQRPWVMKYLRQLGRRLDGGTAESHPEVVVAAALSRAGVAGLERQHRLVLPGYGPARFDLALPQMKWAIEVDVFPTHDETLGAQRDHDRDVAARLQGWVVSRVRRVDYERRRAEKIAELVALHRTLGRHIDLIA
jgi:very-short-patch-repair endonuclease